MRSQTYICPKCKSTKTIIAQPYQSTKEFEEDLPEDLPCGWRGCTSRAIPEGKK